MDNRWRFLYHHEAKHEAVTREDRQSGVMVDSVQAIRLESSKERSLGRLSRDGDRKEVWKLLNSDWREKLLRSGRGACTANRHR